MCAICHQRVYDSLKGAFMAGDWLPHPFQPIVTSRSIPLRGLQAVRALRNAICDQSGTTETRDRRIPSSMASQYISSAGSLATWGRNGRCSSQHLVHTKQRAAALVSWVQQWSQLLCMNT